MFSGSIRLKLSAGMVLLVISLITTAIVGNYIVNQLQEGISIFGEKYLVASSSILNADRDLYQARVAEQAILLGAEADKAFADYEENAQQAFDRMQSYQELMSKYTYINKQLTGFTASFDQWKLQSSKVFSLVQSGERETALKLSSGTSLETFNSLRDLYNLAGEELSKQSALTAITLKRKSDRFILGAAIFLALVITISLVLTYFMPKLLVNSITQLTDRINEISEGDGDLRLRIHSVRNDELGLLANSFDNLIGKLEQLIISVQNKTILLTDNSQVLKESALQSQSISEQQSEAFAVIASSVQEFNISTTEVTSNVQDTAKETNSTVEITKEGVEIIDNSVSQMMILEETVKNVGDSVSLFSTESKNIESVLGVIRGIAEQTNLLALNAAIEAARAGDHGRGFSVVADEVRNLATKTQQSTQEIDEMIERLRNGAELAVQSVSEASDKVVSSVSMIKSTQSLLSDIEISATKVNDMATQIAAAAEEQSQVTKDISDNLSQLNSQNQDNHNLSQKNLSVSTTVTTMVEDLGNEVNRFKVS